MRAALCCAFALLAAFALNATSPTPVSRCGAANDYQSGTVKRPKPSSFAPHAASPNRVYGAPIQPRILKSKPKKDSQLKSAPLPES